MYKLQVVKTERPDKPHQVPKGPKAPKVQKVRQPRNKWSRKRKILTTLVVTTLLVGGMYYYIHKTLTGPAMGTVITSVPTNARKSEVELEQFDGKLYSFVHPVMFGEQLQKPGQVQNNLESHRFVGSQMATQVLTQVVTALPSKNPEDDASYKMRMLDKERYKRKDMVVKNEKVVVFTSDSSGQLEQAAFWVHGDKLLTFVMSGSAADPQETKQQYNDMVTSITWR